MTSAIQGSCLCGSVRFECQINQLPLKIYQCHCTLCKKQSGSSSNSGIILKAEQFKWLAGESDIQAWKKQSGFSAHFCKTCGSPVPNLFANAYYWLPVGLFEDITAEVVANLCLDNQSNWHVLADTARNFNDLPEFSELMKLLS
ncbi:MAG: aldehyde-activating protein [Gammaproteobacteria bacterium]|nr:MAG: aldehyde-activating protein [Gammaproteobacteria bacterium]